VPKNFNERSVAIIRKEMKKKKRKERKETSKGKARKKSEYKDK